MGGSTIDTSDPHSYVGVSYNPFPPRSARAGIHTSTRLTDHASVAVNQTANDNRTNQPTLIMMTKLRSIYRAAY